MQRERPQCTETSYVREISQIREIREVRKIREVREIREISRLPACLLTCAATHLPACLRIAPRPSPRDMHIYARAGACTCACTCTCACAWACSCTCTSCTCTHAGARYMLTSEGALLLRQRLRQPLHRWPGCAARTAGNTQGRGLEHIGLQPCRDARASRRRSSVSRAAVHACVYAHDMHLHLHMTYT